MIRKLLLLLLLALSAPAAAQQAQTLEGTWALRLDGSIIMRWDLDRDGRAWKGVWVKPDSFASDGRRFGSIRMPAVQRQSDKAEVLGEWVELSFPREGSADSDTFRFPVLSPARAERVYAVTGLPHRHGVVGRCGPGPALLRGNARRSSGASVRPASGTLAAPSSRSMSRRCIASSPRAAGTPTDREPTASPPIVTTRPIPRMRS